MRRLLTAALAILAFNNDPSVAQCGIASYHSKGRVTANGERFEKAKISAAHRTASFGTKVIVTGTTSSMSVIVRINDRGRYIEDRIIGLSAGAKKEVLGMSDLAPVCIHVVRFGGKGAAI